MQLVQCNSYTLGLLYPWFRIMCQCVSCSSEWRVSAYMPTTFLSHNIPQLYVCGIIVCSALVDGSPRRSWSPHLRITMGIWDDAAAFLNQDVQLESTPFPVLWLKLVKFWRNTVVLWKWVLIPWRSWKVNVSCWDLCLMEIKLLLRVHRWILHKSSTEGWKC